MHRDAAGDANPADLVLAQPGPGGLTKGSGDMKLFKIRGGVHPQDRKALSAKLAIEDLPLPPLLHVPMQQHIGALV